MPEDNLPAEGPRPVPKLCFERILPGHLQEEAARLAIAENPENRPRFATASPSEAAAVTGSMWAQDRVVRCQFTAGDPRVIARIKAWAAHWLNYVNLGIQWVDSGASDIRIDASYSPPDGSWSNIGTDALVVPQSEATMRFGWLQPNDGEEDYSSVVLHEFGHGLCALIHEHQSPAANIPWNRPKVYQVLGGPPNNWSRQTIDENIFDKLSADQTQYTALDPASIMMYPIDPELTDGKFQVGWNTDLSPTDIAFVSQRWPRAQPAPPPAPPPAPQPQPGPTPAPRPAPIGAAIPVVVNARPVLRALSIAGEKDVFSFAVPGPGIYRVAAIRVAGASPYLVELHGGTYPNPGPIGRANFVTARLTAGVCYFAVRAFDNRSTGQYAVSVRKLGR